MLRDTVITARQKKRELVVFGICLACAVVFNLIGIIKFATPAIEMLTQLHIVLLVAVFFYTVSAIFRFVFWQLAKVLKRNQ